MSLSLARFCLFLCFSRVFRLMVKATRDEVRRHIHPEWELLYASISKSQFVEMAGSEGIRWAHTQFVRFSCLLQWMATATWDKGINGNGFCDSPKAQQALEPWHHTSSTTIFRQPKYWEASLKRCIFSSTRRRAVNGFALYWSVHSTIHTMTNELKLFT